MTKKYACSHRMLRAAYIAKNCPCRSKSAKSIEDNPFLGGALLGILLCSLLFLILL